MLYDIARDRESTRYTNYVFTRDYFAFETLASVSRADIGANNAANDGDAVNELSRDNNAPKRALFQTGILGGGRRVYKWST